MAYASLSVVAAFYVWFYWSYFQLPGQNTTDVSIDIIPVSVIIICKNEADNISGCIAGILQQDYPDFELIVVDDYSSDNTLEILRKIDDKRLTVLQAIENHPGKKSALQYAISQANNDLLLFTDADCIPASPHWVSSMVQRIQAKPHYEIVLGYSPMFRLPTLLNMFSRYETTITAMQYCSYALSGIPYMGVGRNLMYTKQLYLKSGGFEGHIGIASGDDDLFVSQSANRINTTVNTDLIGSVLTSSKGSLASFIRQKARHTTTATHYKPLHQILLGLYAIAQMVFYISVIVGCISNTMSYTCGMSLVLIKWIIQYLFQYNWFSKLDNKDLSICIPLMDVLMVAYYIFLPVYKIFLPKDRW